MLESYFPGRVGLWSSGKIWYLLSSAEFTNITGKATTKCLYSAWRNLLASTCTSLPIGMVTVFRETSEGSGGLTFVPRFALGVDILLC